MGRGARRGGRLIAAGAIPLWGWGAIGFGLGAIVGSYLATLVMRWPRGERTRDGRSRCDCCRRRIAVIDLVPLISYGLRRGLCRYCAGPIDPRQPAMEAMAAALGLIAFVAAPGVAGLFVALFGWGLLALAALDLEHFWLPDRLTGALALLSLAGWLVGLAPSLADRLIGGALGYGALALIAAVYRARRGHAGLGGGDAKLLGAIGLWIGWRWLPLVLLAASLVGLMGVLAARLAGRTIDARTPLPFGACLAVAGWAASLASLP